MNKKKEILKLIIYLIIIGLSIRFYILCKNTEQMTWQCIKAPCPQTNPVDFIPYKVGSIISSGIFGILSIKQIIKIIKK